MKAGILGGGRRGIGSRLLAALAMGAGWVSPMLSGNNGRAVQAARIQAAQAKRDRKADKRAREMRVASWNNAAHQDYREDGGLTRVFPNRLHPFYINRETV